MSFNPPTLPPFPEKIKDRPRSQPRWSVRRYSRPVSVPVNSKLTRRFETEWIEDGQIHNATRVAPALPVLSRHSEHLRMASWFRPPKVRLQSKT